ncbi:MAG: cell surface protein [Cyclobacteriaceae bacterium]|nr:cell surface protein [Cyclobacteriaceae bacterium]
MKLILYISLLLFSASIFVGCSRSQEEKIINPLDYEVYLSRNDESLQKCNKEMAFWRKKLEEVPDGEAYRIKIAGLLSSRFMLNGKIEDIEASDSIYHLIISNNQPYASIHRALAANAITQHKFREARMEIDKAIEIGEGKAASLYMLVDVDLELGDYAGATYAMSQFTNKNFFPYVIREAKLKDHEGKLDSAIVLMEKALDQVKDNASLLLWTQSNLGDMYGHAGRVKDSYKAYLKVLQQNPDYDYALKGIAWIAFSNDHNFAEAKRIVNHIAPKRATPDMHLLLAQIAGAENDRDEKKKQLELFIKSARSEKYGDMYNKYLALLEAEEFSNPSAAIQIAEIEVRNRPTTQSYDLLAWGYFQKGDIIHALTIAREQIENKTHEPDALYHLGMIYQANGMNQEAKRCFEEAEESSFELGPVIAKKIKSQLEG